MNAKQNAIPLALRGVRSSSGSHLEVVVHEGVDLLEQLREREAPHALKCFQSGLVFRGPRASIGEESESWFGVVGVCVLCTDDPCFYKREEARWRGLLARVRNFNSKRQPSTPTPGMADVCRACWAKPCMCDELFDELLGSGTPLLRRKQARPRACNSYRVIHRAGST